MKHYFKYTFHPLIAQPAFGPDIPVGKPMFLPPPLPSSPSPLSICKTEKRKKQCLHLAAPEALQSPQS